MNNLPPVCPGTKDHFEKHVFDPEEAPVLNIARFQAGAWDDLSTENGDQASTNANEWRSWETT